MSDIYNENENTVSARKRGFSAGSFAGGLGVGLFVAFVVTIVFAVYLIFFMKPRTSGTNSTGNPVASPAYSVLDEATINKLEEIQGTFMVNSILELDVDEMRRGLIDGMIEATGDKYAKYYSAEEFDALMGDYGGSFYGIGATLAHDADSFVEVQGVYKDSPAEKGGLIPGDLIVKIDGVDVTHMSLDEAVDLIRGDKGEPVVLTVVRDGESDYLELTLYRDEIKPTVVEYEMIDGHIGFIHIIEWHDTTLEQFKSAMEDLRSQGMDGLIIDLRSNTGGLLTSVCNVCRELLPTGTIVSTEDARGNRYDEVCDGSKEIDIPVVILTNGYTASASEIFTGAMKDHGKAVSIGTKTYGKGVVQGFHQFTDGSAIKLTIEQYFTPNGTAIDGVGISPDYEIIFDSDAYYKSETPFDNQKDAAVRYLNGEKI